MLNWLKTAFVAAMVFIGSSAHAQDWRYSASVYLFTAETKTDIGDRSATLSFSDALKNLDMAFMGSFEANNGQWGVLLDYMLTDVSFNKKFSRPAGTSLDTSVKTQILTGYLSYQLYDTGSVKSDALLGVRRFDTDTTLTLSGAGSRSLSDNWTDPVIGLRSQFRLNDEWSGTFVADYGGINDRETWQLLLTSNYQINDNWVARFGYRHLDVTNDERANSYNFKQSGPVVGITYHF